MLIGGLGMGFTVAAALRRLGPAARLVVAELVPKVVEWNRYQLAPLAGQPLLDQRVTVQIADVSMLISEGSGVWDAILLDVDNGPDGLTRRENSQLYSLAGLKAAFAALRKGGVLAIWSAAPDQAFTRRLRQAGFRVDEVGARARGAQGRRHTIWLAQRDSI
jgi:spermidine synthase